MFGYLYNLLKCGQSGGRGGDNLPPRGPQIHNISGVEPKNYDYINDADDDNFGDDYDYDVMLSSCQLTPNTIGTRGDSEL